MPKYHFSARLVLAFFCIYILPAKAMMTEDLCSQMLQQQYKDEHLSQTQVTTYCNCVVPKINALLDKAIEMNIPQTEINKRMADEASYCLKKAGVKISNKAK